DPLKEEFKFVKDYDKKSIQELINIYPASRKRISFELILKDPWLILNHELDFNSLSILIGLSIPLEIEISKFYICVINKLLSNPCLNQQIINQIKNCLELIKDKQVAVGVAKYCADQFDSGNFKIEFLKLSFKLANEWKNEIEKRVEGGGDGKRVERDEKIKSGDDNSKDNGDDKENVKINTTDTMSHDAIDKDSGDSTDTKSELNLCLKALNKLEKTISFSETEFQLKELGLERLMNENVEKIISDLFEIQEIDFNKVCSEISSRHSLDFENVKIQMI
ncbi:hypothetical protein ROZALSC1DRAFT_25448, partial [Rozella allomycis CSF55]